MTDPASARSLHAQGRLNLAEPLYRAALRASPGDVTLRRDLAVLLMQARKEGDALALFEHHDIDASPDADLLTILTLCYRATERYEQGLALADRIVALEPGQASGWLLKGSLHVLLGHHASGEMALRASLRIEGRLPESWHYLGEALQAQRRWDEAIAAYRQAQHAQPREVLNIALCHERAGRLEDATAGYQEAHYLMPGRADVLTRLAYSQSSLCRFDASSRTRSALSDRLRTPLAKDDRPEPFLLTALGLPEAAKISALEHYAERFSQTASRTCAVFGLSQDDIIRIGYISPDFGEHAVGDLLRAHFSAHDRTRFHVTAYALRTYDDPVNRDIRQGVDTYRICDAMDDFELAETIRLDRIDVLVDLAGYTAGGRPGVLARRPAPLQIGWLGFLDGQQAPWLDALVMDRHLLPERANWPYRDAIVRIPTTVFPGSPQAIGTADRVRFGLPLKTVLLCSFNNTYKIDPTLVLAWIEILRLAPDAHFVIFLPDAARAGFLNCWLGYGGDRERLHIVGKVSIADHADRLASCDLMLDAFRYQGGATSMHAIANGLPVLSMSGTMPTERFGASINGFLGLDVLMCGDADAYVGTAARLANSPEELSSLRRRVAARVRDTGLFDPRRSASAIESLLIGLMAERRNSPGHVQTGQVKHG